MIVSPDLIYSLFGLQKRAHFTGYFLGFSTFAIYKPRKPKKIINADTRKH